MNHAPTNTDSWPAVPIAPARRLDAFDLLFGAAFLLLLLLATRLPFGPNRLGDMDFYVEAKALAGTLRGAVAWSDVAMTKAPGPVLFFTVPFLFVPTGAAADAYWFAGVLWSGLCTMTAILLIRRTAAALAGPLAGYTAALLVLLVPFPVYYCLGILAEPPAFIGTAVFLFGWVQWWRRGGFRCLWSRELAVTGAGLALLVLSRPNAMLLVPLGLAAAGALALSRDPFRRRAAAAAVLAVFAAILLMTVALAATRLLPGRREAQRQGAYLSYILVQGRFQYRNEPWNWQYWDQDRRGTPDYDAWQAQLRTLNTEATTRGLPESQVQWRWLARDFLEHPFLTLRMAAVRLVTQQLVVVHSASPARFRIGPVSGALVYAGLHLGVNALSLSILAAAIVTAVRQRRHLDLAWALPGVWLALLLFNLVSYAEPRYLFPAQPAVLVLAALSVAPVVASRLRRKT